MYMRATLRTNARIHVNIYTPVGTYQAMASRRECYDVALLFVL